MPASSRAKPSQQKEYRWVEVCSGYLGNFAESEK